MSAVVHFAMSEGSTGKQPFDKHEQVVNESEQGDPQARVDATDGDEVRADLSKLQLKFIVNAPCFE